MIQAKELGPIELLPTNNAQRPLLSQIWEPARTDLYALLSGMKITVELHGVIIDKAQKCAKRTCFQGQILMSRSKECCTSKPFTGLGPSSGSWLNSQLALT